MKEFFEQLVDFLEGLAEEQLAIFDIVLDVGPELGAEERDDVKKLASDLPAKLSPKLVSDWRKRQRRRAAVSAVIKDVFDDLPEAFSDEQYEAACEAVYSHVYESYFGEGKSKYITAPS